MKINPAIFHRTKIVYFIVVHANLSVNEYNGFQHCSVTPFVYCYSSFLYFYGVYFSLFRSFAIQ